MTKLILPYNKTQIKAKNSNIFQDSKKMQNCQCVYCQADILPGSWNYDHLFNKGMFNNRQRQRGFNLEFKTCRSCNNFKSKPENTFSALMSMPPTWITSNSQCRDYDEDMARARRKLRSSHIHGLPLIDCIKRSKPILIPHGLGPNFPMVEKRTLVGLRANEFEELYINYIQGLNFAAFNKYTATAEVEVLVANLSDIDGVTLLMTPFVKLGPAEEYFEFLNGGVYAYGWITKHHDAMAWVVIIRQHIVLTGWVNRQNAI